MTAYRKKAAPAKRKVKKRGGLWRIFFIIVLAFFALLPFYYGYVAQVVAPAWRWVRDLGTSPQYRVYKNFNIRIPSQYPIHGIDVSSYQGHINWQLVKNMRQDSVHINFAFIKATEGLIQVDQYFERNWREAPKAGIICGAYHYFRPKMDGKWQAKFFLQNVKPRRGDLPPTVDIEDLDGVQPESMRKGLTDFLKETTAKTGRKPIIYTGLKFYNDYLQGFFDDYPLWLASYENPQMTMTSAAHWKFWQHSDKAHVSGVFHGVDFDVFRGDSAAFRKMLIN